MLPSPGQGVQGTFSKPTWERGGPMRRFQLLEKPSFARRKLHQEGTSCFLALWMPRGCSEASSSTHDVTYSLELWRSSGRRKGTSLKTRATPRGQQRGEPRGPGSRMASRSSRWGAAQPRPSPTGSHWHYCFKQSERGLPVHTKVSPWTLRGQDFLVRGKGLTRWKLWCHSFKEPTLNLPCINH